MPREPDALRSLCDRFRLSNGDSVKLPDFPISSAAKLELLLIELAFVAISFPSLLNPAATSNDASVYFAAGQRLNAGESLYHWLPGERAVNFVQGMPGVALISHPTIAVPWRLLALMPGDSSMWIWWVGGLAAVLLSSWVVLRDSTVAVAGSVLLLGFDLSWSALSGNVNAYLIPVLLGVWVAWTRARSAATGGLVALAVAMKLTPVLLVWWLVVSRQWAALRWAIAGLFVALVLTIAVAGLSSTSEWFDVARQATGVASYGGDIESVLSAARVPIEVAKAIAPVAVVLTIAAVWVLRNRAGAAFAASVVGVTLATPASHSGSLALLLPALAPLALGSIAGSQSPKGLDLRGTLGRLGRGKPERPEVAEAGVDGQAEPRAPRDRPQP